MFAVPILLTSYYNAEKSIATQRIASQERLSSYNERLSIGPVNPYNPLYQRAGWVPGVWINNTGTVPVTLAKLYLINIANNTIYAVLNLTDARPGTTPLISDMLLDVNPVTLLPEKQLPPPGTPITLQPGDTLLVAFNSTLIAPIAGSLVVRVESANGIMHPVAGGGAGQTLLSPPQGAGGAGQAGASWRGIYAPQSGFKLIGYDELVKEGSIEAWRPPIHVYTAEYSWWYGLSPSSIDFLESFIYDDTEYPGLYYLYVVVNDEGKYLVLEYNGGRNIIPLESGYQIVVRGFVGTYDTGPEDQPATYINGYAFEVEVLDSYGNTIIDVGPYSKVVLPTSTSVSETDFDENGVKELTVYSYLNGPAFAGSSIDVDADNDGSDLTDALVWTYMVARDISGVDFISITAKINYYWTDTFYGSCPTWNFRHLKIFSLAVWRYNPSTGSWVLYQRKDFTYTNNKPLQFQVTAFFPVDRNGTYRVGVIFYDNYRDWEGYGYECYKDFTYSLEYLLVEYGVVNPYFKESPPVYIVAIPDSSIISGIGEEEYAALHNVSIDDAKVDAMNEILNLLKGELGYAGVTGYTVITSADELYKLLFVNPPKYAIIYWLQGNVSIDSVLGAYGVDTSTLRDYIYTYHWVWVWPYGNLSGIGIDTLEGGYALLSSGPYMLNITPAGLAARSEAYAFYLYPQVNFTQAVEVGRGVNWSTVVVWNATFYADNASSPTLFGTAALWVYNPASLEFGGGMVIYNPVHVDWNHSGDGAVPETVVQQIVYSSLRAWSILRFGSTS